MIRLTYGIGIISLYVCVIKAGLDSSINSGNDTTITEDKCLTTECHIDRLRSSLSILLYMNESVSPCDNFYKFVCGNYERVSNIDNNKPFTVTQKSSDQMINKNLYNSIKKINVTTESSRPRKLVKEFFDMCMDTKTREYRGTKSLMEIIKKLHGWPMVEGDSWDSSNWRLENVHNEAIKLGVPTDSFMFNIKPSELGENRSALLQLSTPQMEFSRQRLSNRIRQDKAIQSYYDFVINIAIRGFKIPPNIAVPELEAVIDFEFRLIEQYPSIVTMKSNITKLRKTLTNVDWDTVFNLSTYGIEIDSIAEPIAVTNPMYLNFINRNLPDKRIVANYQIWKFIQYAASYLNSEISQIKKDYMKIRHEAESSAEDLWESCVHTVRKSLPHIADAIFIQDYFDKDIKREVMEMIENIKEQFMKTLNSISWLDESSRKWAMTRLNATKYLVAYPDEAYDNETLDELYKDYEIVEGDFLKTVLRFNYLSQTRIMSHYKTYNETSYETLPSWIKFNARNIITANTIQILAGVLQDDQYDKNRPQYINYATVGNTIAHEMAHNFGLGGLYFANNGYYDSINIFNRTVQAMYDTRMNCLIEHYSRYKYPKTDLPVKSDFHLNENMADVNGIRLAYHAYQQWVKKHGPEPVLPYANFTTNQLYWIRFAHAHCKAFEVQDVIESSYDVHPTYDVRVMGSVSNSPEFAADFNCPINSKMNPINKCIFS